MPHVGQEGIRTMDIIKKRIVKELEKKGMIISSVEKTDNNVYTLTGIYNEKRGSVRVRVIELDPEKFYYDDIIIPGLWEQIYIDIVFMDDNNFIFFLTSTMRHPKTISKNSHQIIGLWTDAFSSEALSWSSYFRLLAGIPLS